MEKTIVGAYDSTTEVMNTVDSLTKEGYSRDDILVISRRGDFQSLDNTSGLHVEHPDSGDESRSLWEKIKDSFMVAEHEQTDRDISQYDIPVNQVGTYQSKLEEGKILVAVTAQDQSELSHGGDVESGANIKPVAEGEESTDLDMNTIRNQTTVENNYRNSPTAGKSIGNHGAEPGDVRSGNVDTSEDTIGGNVGNTLGGKLGTSEGYPTGQEGLESHSSDETEKEKRDHKNTKNLDGEDYKVNDYRGDM
ncbi:general stress protein [Bacillus sp. AK031]